MRILHFIPSLDRKTGGTASYLETLINELGKYAEVYIITMKTSNPVEINNAKVIYIDLRLKRIFSMYKTMQRLIKEIKPEIVHVNVIWMPQPNLMQKVADQNNIKVVLTPHGMMEPWILARNSLKKKIALFLYQRKSLKKAYYIHTTSASEKNNFLKLHYNSNVVVIPNSINVDNIKIKDSWKRKKRILFLSRIHVVKGIDLLIDAISQMKESLSDYKITIAGEGDEEYVQKMREYAKNKGIFEILDFVGGVYGDEKWKLMRDADVFILPTHTENFGMVIAESLACGTPVITTKGAPWPELNTANCGWWVDLNIDAIKKALEEFISISDIDLETLGRNGRNLIVEKYNSKIIAESMYNLYTNILDNGQ